MASTYTNTIFNSTYKDDYKDSNNFHRILFNSGKALQARELTQMQTIINKEIERFGGNIFKDGAMVRPGGVTVNNQIEYIKLNTSSNTLPADPNTLVGLEITGATSGVKAKVIDVLKDSGAGLPATLYVHYTDTTGGTAGTTAIKMTASENITSSAGTLTVDSSATATGVGTRASVNDGDYYVQGHFVNAQSQSKIIDRYSGSPSKDLGFVVNESIISAGDDATLYDNQGASPNLSAPGADRYKINLQLTTKDTLIGDSSWCHVANVVNGVITTQPTAVNDYNRINDLLATRTKEESGDYIAKQFLIKFDSADDSALSLNVSSGIAYIDGYRAAPDTSIPLNIQRAQQSATYNNEASGANYGNYIYVQDSGCDGINIAVGADRGAKGIPQLMVDSCTIYDKAGGVDAAGNAIGKTRLKAIEKGGNSGVGGNTLSTYKYYLSNVEMYAGQAFRNAKSIGSAANVWFNPVLNNGKTVLNEAENNNLFFTLPHDRPKALSDFNLTVQRRLTGTTNASGAVTFGTLSNETYVDTTSWVFASVDSATFEPTVTGSGTTSAAITGGPKSKNIVALAYINKAVAATAVQRTKTLATVTSYPPKITSGSVTYYDLQKPDIYEVTSIQDTNSSGVDVSSKFIVDNGQRDNYYDKGRLILKPGQTQTNSIYVSFKHFTHGAGQFFTAQSYPAGVPYAKIPSHETKNGETVDLRDVYDFRHAVDSAGVFGSAGFNAVINEIPKNTDIISADVEYYLPRRDKLVVNKEGVIEYLYGASGYETKEVDNPDGTMQLYNINMNAYTINDSDLSLEKIEARRYTMQDIGQVEKRIERLEETTALSLMEVDTRNFEVLDSSGINRTKSGFVVDNFANHFQTDTLTYEHRASIDPKNKILRPSFWEDNVRLLYDSATSKTLAGSGGSGVVQKGDNIYLEYSEDSAYSNLLATQTENVNPFAVISHVGHIDMSPASDDWKESRKAAPKVIDGGVKIDKSQANNWNNWEWNWTGQDAAALATGTTLSERQSTSEVGNQIITYKQTNYVAANEVIREKIGERVLDLALIPYMRSKKIFFRAQGLKPNTQVFAFFNGTPIPDWVRAETSFERYGNSEIDYGSRYNKATSHPDTASTLTTTDSGSILGSFFIPNTDTTKFRTGDVEFKLLDISVNQDSVATSGAKEYFTSRGVLETIEETVRSTRNIRISYGSKEISRRDASRPSDNRDWDRNPGFTTTGKFSSNSEGSGKWSINKGSRGVGYGRLHNPPSDPIAQSFYIKENSGVFITKARIFFQAKDANIPVCVQLRPMVNGVPSSNIIPGAVKYLPPASVNVSATPSNITDVRGTPTDFTFEEPVYLSPYREYALVVRAETNGYKVYTCRGGDFLVGSTEARVSKQPSLGSFFKSQNGSTWTPDQHSDMMFTLFKADFVNTGKVTLETGPTAPVLLQTDPINTTNASTTVSVSHQGHGFVVGDLVSINGVTTSDSSSFASAEMGGSGNSGILGSEIDGGRTITKVDWTGYTFVADGSAASGTVSGGGSALRATQNHQFDQFMPNIQILTPPGTALEAATKFHSGKSFGGSETAYTIDTAWTQAQINRNNYLSAPRMIASRENELAGSNISTSNNPNKRSGLIGIAMGTNDSRVSPVIDLQRASLTVINNIIDKHDAAATTNGFSVPITYKAETDPIGGSSGSKHISKTITLAEDAVGLKAILAANIPANSTFDLYYKTGTDDDVLDDISWVLASRENTVTYDDNPNVYRDHTYLIGGQGGNEIAAFTKFKLKIVFVGYNSSKVPTIKDMRVIALAT